MACGKFALFCGLVDAALLCRAAWEKSEETRSFSVELTVAHARRAVENDGDDRLELATSAVTSARV
jgi:hypothetical protein